MENFITLHQKRAYHQALLFTKHHEEAMDLVQSAFTKWLKSYKTQPETQWKALFFSVLQSTLVDWFRKQKVRRLLGFGHVLEDDEQVETTLWQTHSQLAPHKLLEQAQDSQAMIAKIAKLPFRQKQVFLLRVWEGLSTKEAAKAMTCSEGSVKTHYARARLAIFNEPADIQNTGAVDATT